MVARVQIDQNAAAQQAHVVMETPDGGDLALNPGRQFVARVVAAGDDGTAKISLAGQVLRVQSTVQLQPGDEIRLSVAQANSSTVQLTIVPSQNAPAASAQAQAAMQSTQPAAAAAAESAPVVTSAASAVAPAAPTSQSAAQLQPSTAAPAAANAAAPAVLVPTTAQATNQQQQQSMQQGSQQPQSGVQGVITELAKLGVPVSPTLADAVAKVVDHLGGGVDSTRAVTQLASRDLGLSSAAATRVAAALEVAGKIGPALEHLATRAPIVAAALPTSAPSAAALRNILAPALEPAELAVARIVNASASAPQAATIAPSVAASIEAYGPAAQAAAATNTPPASESAVAALRSYVTAKLAASATDSTSALRLDQTLTRQPSKAAASATDTSTAARATVPPPLGAPATQAQQAQRAAVIGQAALPQALANTSTTDAAIATSTGTAATARQAVSTGANATAPLTADDPAPLPVAAQRTSATAATAAAATGTSTALATPTPAPVANAVADLATLAARIAPTAGPVTGALADAAAQQGGATNAVQTAQQAGMAGAAGTAAATNAGAGASGDPRPLVTAMQQMLASGGSASERAALLRTLAGSDHATLAAAIRQLPEEDALRLAGGLLDSIPSRNAAATPGPADPLRNDVRRVLDDLGRALAHGVHHGDTDELANLRTALQQVASSDARPTVASDAARMLGALDGQQLLSRTQSGADAGYLYFQLPLPDGRGAEVVVRRDPARRTVSFDEFNIAFLLDTEQLGTLMIQLDAQPSGIRADVKTDVPALQPFLEAQSSGLVEPLARESRRPVTISIGTFDAAPPSSLLEPQLGLVTPGMTEYYA